MKITPKCYEAFAAHVLAEFPNEACGLVVNGRYKPMKNIHPKPEESFEIDAREYMKYDVQAVLHSHVIDNESPRGYPYEWPSGSDQQGFIDSAVPWGIAVTSGEAVGEVFWMDDNDRAPLKGRVFSHGHHDCYGLIRDWFKLERDIDLPNFSRPWGWWKDHQTLDLYEKNFEKAGFYEVPFAQATVGDCLLIRYGARVINHAAVITGQNTMLHHVYSMHGDMLSGEDPIASWSDRVVRAVRYKGKK